MAEETADNSTEEVDPPMAWDQETDPDGYTREDITSKDWYLDTVLNFVHGMNDEHSGGYVGLTVTSNGVVVSGMAISRAEWIAGVADQYKQGGSDDTNVYVENLFNRAHDSVVEQAKARSDADLPPRARRFLHMRAARIGAGNVYTQVPLWRGTLADITGWSMGSWNPKPNEDDE